MTENAILTCYLLAMFGLTVAGTLMQFAATAKLAQWLYHHHREVWRELGCPGTNDFQGDSDNGSLSRKSALQSMQRLMPLHAYRRQLNNDEAQRYLQQHRLGGLMSVIFMLLFGVGIFYGAVRDQFRSSSPSNKPGLFQDEPVPSGGNKPSN